MFKTQEKIIITYNKFVDQKISKKTIGLEMKTNNKKTIKETLKRKNEIRRGTMILTQRCTTSPYNQ
jgi:hypothetical protein